MRLAGLKGPVAGAGEVSDRAVWVSFEGEKHPILVVKRATSLGLLLAFRYRDGAPRRDQPSETVGQRGRGDRVDPERDRLDARTADLAGVVQADDVAVPPCRQIPVHLGEECAAAARQQLLGLSDVLDRVAEHEDTRAAWQGGEGPQHA